MHQLLGLPQSDSVPTMAAAYRHCPRTLDHAAAQPCARAPSCYNHAVIVTTNLCNFIWILPISLPNRSLLSPSNVTMPPKKTKAEEALAFLDDLDNLEAPPGSTDAAAPAATPGSARPSTDSANRGKDEASTEPPPDAEAADALAFLEAQINQKRGPLSKPASSSTPRTASPQLGGSSAASAAAAPKQAPVQPAPSSAAQPSSPPGGGGGGWGVASFWSSATSAIQSAQRVADEQYRKVRTEGVSGLRDQIDQLHVGGVDMAKLRKDAEERIGGIVKGVGNVDLDKLRE